MARKTELSILIAAKKLLTPKKRWTRGTWARDANGNPVKEWDPSAVSFCVSGAINRAAGDYGQECTRAKRAFGRVIRAGDILNFNDAPHRTHKQVLAAFDRAIARLRKAA